MFSALYVGLLWECGKGGEKRANKVEWGQRQERLREEQIGVCQHFTYVICKSIYLWKLGIDFQTL